MRCFVEGDRIRRDDVPTKPGMKTSLVRDCLRCCSTSLTTFMIGATFTERLIDE